MERSSGAVRTAQIQIDGRRGAGGASLIGRNRRRKTAVSVKLTTIDPQERSTWRSGVRSAMGAAIHLPGRGPTDVDDAPAPAC